MLDHMPLLMVCLEGLGKLAKKFPSIAGTSISYLRDFLVDPSPILAKLHSQAVIQQKKEKEIAPYRIVGRFEFHSSTIKVFIFFFSSFSSKSRAAFNRR
jgi:phosphatidylinositol 4-kinase